MSRDRDDLLPPVDLTPLDPFTDPERLEARLAAIVTAGMNARRHPRAGVVRQIGGWATPVLIAAALVIAIAIPAAMRVGPPPAVRAVPSATTIADVARSRFGLPAPVIDLIRSAQPTPAEIIAAFNARSHTATQ